MSGPAGDDHASGSGTADPGPPRPAGPDPGLRGVPWRTADVLVGLAPLAALWAVAGLVDFSPLPAAGQWAVAAAAVAAVVGWLLGYPLWVARRRGGYRPRLPTPRRFAAESALAVPALLLTWVVLVAVVAGWQAALGGWGRGEGNPAEQIAASPDGALVALFAVLAVFVAPVSEEVFFRGMLYNALRRRLPLPAAVVLHPARDRTGRATPDSAPDLIK